MDTDFLDKHLSYDYKSFWRLSSMACTRHRNSQHEIVIEPDVLSHCRCRYKSVFFIYHTQDESKNLKLTLISFRFSHSVISRESSKLIRAITLATVFVGSLASNASGDHLTARFRQVEDGRTAHEIVYSEPFDVWVFEACNMGSSAPSVSASFLGDFINTVSPTSFRDEVDNPLVFGLEAPETFFLVPPGTSEFAVDVVDTDSQLSASYTIPGSQPIVPTGVITPIAWFSVPAGTPMDFSNLLNFSIGIDGELIVLPLDGAPLGHCVAIPEPSALLLLSFGVMAFLAPHRGKHARYPTRKR